jgi:O-antigen ligase
MSLLLASLMALVVAQQLFAMPMSLGPGMSVENALLYVVAGALAFKIAVQRNLRFELRGLHMCFAVLLIYTALSIPAAALIADYWGYRPLAAIIAFKARMFDQFVFFAVFFYGLRSSQSALNVLKALLLMTAIANLVALLDAWGIVEAAGLVERDDGRAQGVMGESNQSAAFIASFLPGLAAFAFMTRGFTRLVWIAGLVISGAAMTISASRGGFLSTIVAVICGLFYFRRYISGRAIMTAAAIGAVILAIVLPIIASKYGWLLVNRIVDDSTSSNLAGASSGRLGIWSGALSVMAESPLSFFTGFGWFAYDAMPFRFATHNHYLSLWFDLGLVGLIYGTALLVFAMRIATRAVQFAPAAYRPVLMSFAIGTLAISIATFFVNLYTPWLWFWAYAGLALRIAANALSAHAESTATARSANIAATAKQDPFGWVSPAAQGTHR